MQEIVDSVVNQSYKETMGIINKAIGSEGEHNNINFALSENLTENAKRKDLICRLSALLDEEYKSCDSAKIKVIEDNLFGTDAPIDIEHIQSYLNRNKEKREDILLEWGNDINSIGNLIILERGINRSISNKDYCDKISNKGENCYLTSKFKIIENQVNSYKEWDLEKCRERKGKEIQKLVNYLFS